MVPTAKHIWSSVATATPMGVRYCATGASVSRVCCIARSAAPTMIQEVEASRACHRRAVLTVVYSLPISDAATTASKAETPHVCRMQSRRL